MNKFFVILSCLLGYIVSDLVFLSELQADAKAKCSSFTCSTTQNADKHCVQVDGDNALGTRKVDMNACLALSHCDTPIDVFTGNVQVTKECVVTQEVTPRSDRFPGEPCDTNHTCVMVPRKQEDGTWKTVANTCNTDSKTCDGPTEQTQNCVADACCNAGDYCKIGAEAGAVGDCTPQVGDLGACELTLDCANTHVCYQKICTAAYSFKLNQHFIMADFTPSTDAASICESARWAAAEVATDLYCVNQQYDNEAHPSSDVSNGLVKCDMGSKCSYTNFWEEDRTKHSKVITMDCACLPNGGQGYCPLAGEFSSMANQAREVLNNKRHTSARKNPFDRNSRCNGYESRMWSSVEQCVRDVFGVGECSTNYVNMAFGLLALLFTLF